MYLQQRKAAFLSKFYIFFDDIVHYLTILKGIDMKQVLRTYSAPHIPTYGKNVIFDLFYL